jgi:hypothetical protein
VAIWRYQYDTLRLFLLSSQIPLKEISSLKIKKAIVCDHIQSSDHLSLVVTKVRVRNKHQYPAQRVWRSNCLSNSKRFAKRLPEMQIMDFTRLGLPQAAMPSVAGDTGSDPSIVRDAEFDDFPLLGGPRIMSADVGQQVRVWSFHHAPLRLKQLFPGGRDPDWVTHIPAPGRSLVEHSLSRWRPIYPVKSIELADQSVVYWGAEGEAIAMLAKWIRPVTSSPPAGIERRTGVRVQLECPSRYETRSGPKQVGLGHTIDLSGAGISFTTESMLPQEMRMALLVKWPVPLEDEVPVELRAIGKLVRTDATRATLKVGTLTFSTADA